MTVITKDSKLNLKNGRPVPKGHRVRIFSDNKTFVVALIFSVSGTGKRVRWSKHPVSSGYSMVNTEAGDEFNFEFGKYVAVQRAIEAVVTVVRVGEDKEYQSIFSSLKNGQDGGRLVLVDDGQSVVKTGIERLMSQSL